MAEKGIFSSLFDKSTWINESNEDKKESTPAESTSLKMPNSTAPVTFPKETTQVVTPVVGNTDCSMHMEQVMKMYEKGFESLNRPGIEFFEYFQSVVKAGADNAMAYKMAFDVLHSMENNLNKESLLSQSQFYVDEIVKVHTGYTTSGSAKVQQIQDERDVEQEQLKNEIFNLTQQLETIKNQLAAKEISLNQIDNKYNPQIEDVKCKMMANDQARDRILFSIQKVVEGIKANL